MWDELLALKNAQKPNTANTTCLPEQLALDQLVFQTSCSYWEEQAETELEDSGVGSALSCASLTSC